MEIAAKSIEQQLEMHDQSVVYQLRRSFHKIQELKEEIDKIRRDKDSQLVLLSTLQQQLRDSRKEIALLQSRNMDLVGELESLSKKISIIQSNDETLVLEEQLQILKGRYYNCQEENTILRGQLKAKDQTLGLYADKLVFLANSNKTQEKTSQDLLDKLEKTEAKVADLQAAYAYLQQANIQSRAREKEAEEIIDDYKDLLLRLHLQVGQAQRAEEGWFCQFSDLKQTVEHIEQARANFRLKKLVKNQ